MQVERKTGSIIIADAEIWKEQVLRQQRKRLTLSTLPFTFHPQPIDQITTLTAALTSLASPIDSFLEDHIRAAQFVAIVDLQTGQPVGHAAIHETIRLTHYYLQPAWRRYGQAIYQQVRHHFNITQALVPTCDEFFLSHALDDYVELHKQAYFFVASAPVGPWTDRPDLHFRQATIADYAATAALNDDFIDKLAERIGQGEIHIGALAGNVVTLGIRERGQLLPDCASIGMLVDPAYRQQGIGTRMLRYLRTVCEQEGLRPLAGCGYDNTLSKRTLEAAGMVTVTRLLRVHYQ